MMLAEGEEARDQGRDARVLVEMQVIRFGTKVDN